MRGALPARGLYHTPPCHGKRKIQLLTDFQIRAIEGAELRWVTAAEFLESPLLFPNKPLYRVANSDLTEIVKGEEVILTVAESPIRKSRCFEFKVAKN